jgi:hypothetical protein
VGNGTEPTPKRQKYVQLTQEQFDQLFDRKNNAQPDTLITPSRSPALSIPSVTPLTKRRLPHLPINDGNDESEVVWSF